ncbi:MAG TPA: hypothetical protein VGM54_05795 [Chthoniobacter sp.]|jgi:hypothetical protein
MKTTKLITTGIVALCALGASAMAVQNNEAQKKPANMEQKSWNNEQPMALRVIGYPVVFLERAGHSLIDSPQIVSQTFKGQRTIVSKNGLLTRRESAANGEAR